MTAKVAVSFTTYYCADCPYCEAENFVYNGDESDITRWDVEAVECHKCSKKFWLGEPMDEADDIDEAHYEEGVAFIGETP